MTTEKTNDFTDYLSLVWVQIVVLCTLYLVIHIPTLQLDFLRDDIFILARCESTSWSDLLVNGFQFSRTNFGNVWWITVKDIAHFFRPLLLTTFKLTISVFGNNPGVHHLINVLIHIFTSIIILLTGRRFLKNKLAPFAGAAFFLFSMHNQWTVMWIVARKELLVGLFMLLAFNFHLSKRTALTTVAMICGMMCGEHAVAFPFLAVAWDLLTPSNEVTGQSKSISKRDGENTNPTDIPGERRIFQKVWLVYFGGLVAYIAVRHMLLGGLPLPPSPYFTHPLSKGAWSFYLVKKIQFVCALTISLLFVDRPIMTFWMNYPITMVLCIALTVATLWLAWIVSGKNKLLPRFWVLSFISFLPFTPMVAMPIYLYTPMIFFSIAVAVSLNRPLSTEYKDYTKAMKFFTTAVFVCILLHAAGTTLWTYSRFNETFSYPIKAAPQIARIIKNLDTDRPIVLVDLPAHALTLPYLLQSATHRSGEMITAVSMQVGKDEKLCSTVRKSAPGEWIIENKKVPYFKDPRARALAFLPKGLLKKDLQIHRDWFTVAINELGPTPPASARGHRFFTTEPSVYSIRFSVSDTSVHPIFVAFRGETPYLLFD